MKPLNSARANREIASATLEMDMAQDWDTNFQSPLLPMEEPRWDSFMNDLMFEPEVISMLDNNLPCESLDARPIRTMRFDSQPIPRYDSPASSEIPPSHVALSVQKVKASDAVARFCFGSVRSSFVRINQLLMTSRDRF